MYLCLSTVKFKSRLLLAILALLIIAPLIGHYYLSKVNIQFQLKKKCLFLSCVNTFQEENDEIENSYNTHSKLEVYEDYGVLRATDLKHRIAELVRIKSIKYFVIKLNAI